MTVLSDQQIARRVAYGDMAIDPYDEERLQPASYDVVLEDGFMRPIDSDTEHTFRFDLAEGIPEQLWETIDDDSVVVPSGSFVLASTQARFSLPDDVTLSVEPRSSAARNGLVTDGWGDPGWDGTITIEVYNGSPYDMEIHAGESYCQFVFERTGRPAARPYRGRYQGQDGVTPSR